MWGQEGGPMVGRVLVRCEITSRCIFRCRTHRLLLPYQRLAKGPRSREAMTSRLPSLFKNMQTHGLCWAIDTIISMPVVPPKTPDLSKNPLDDSWWSLVWFPKELPSQKNHWKIDYLFGIRSRKISMSECGKTSTDPFRLKRLSWMEVLLLIFFPHDSASVAKNGKYQLTQLPQRQDQNWQTEGGFYASSVALHQPQPPLTPFLSPLCIFKEPRGRSESEWTMTVGRCSPQHRLSMRPSHFTPSLPHNYVNAAGFKSHMTPTTVSGLLLFLFGCNF